MKKIKLLIAAFAVVFIGAFALVPATSVGAIDPLGAACAESPDSEICTNKGEDAPTLIKTLINTLLFVVGALAVVMIIVSGVLYVISTGDAGKVAKAKNTLMYSIVGLVVSFLAYAVVNWVLDVL